MAHALVHILGSRTGYTTLDASPGITADERAELEVLGFGDVAGSDAMAELEVRASMAGRRLRSGRYAISRMLPGGTDDKGRPTIEVISLLLDRRGYGSVVGSLAMLADDVRFWRLARGAVARGYELPEEQHAASPRDTEVLRAFDTWIAARKHGGIGLLAPPGASALLGMVALLDSEDLADCRWGVGLFSLSAPVDICTLAPSTSPIGPRPVVRASADGAWLSPEMAHVEWHVAQNPLFPLRRALVSAVRIEPALDGAATTGDVSGLDHRFEAHTEQPRRNMTTIAAITAVASLAVLVMTTAVYVRTGRAVNVGVEVPDLSVDPSAGFVGPPSPGETSSGLSQSGDAYARYVTASADQQHLDGNPSTIPAPPGGSLTAPLSSPPVQAQAPPDAPVPKRDLPTPIPSSPLNPFAVDVNLGPQTPSQQDDTSDRHEGLPEDLSRLRDSVKKFRACASAPPKKYPQESATEFSQRQLKWVDSMIGDAFKVISQAALDDYHRSEKLNEAIKAANMRGGEQLDIQLIQDRSGFIHWGESTATARSRNHWPNIPMAEEWVTLLLEVKRIASVTENGFNDVWIARINVFVTQDLESVSGLSKEDFTRLKLKLEKLRDELLLDKGSNRANQVDFVRKAIESMTKSNAVRSG